MSAQERGVTHISIWTMWSGQEEQNFQKVLDRYHELHPDIIVDNLGAVNDDTKTVRAIVAGAPPDLFTLADPLYLGPLAANDALMPVDDLFRKSGLREEDFIPASLRQCRYRGQQYAMPYLIDCYALMWNKQAFREAGLDPERPPQSMEEMIEYGLKLTRVENGEIKRLGLDPFLIAPDAYNVTYPLFGGRLYDAARNRITPDDPANIAAMKWYLSVINQFGGYDKVDAYKAGYGATQGANNPFFVGKIAMMVNGEWNPWWCHRYAPNLDYGVAPVPPFKAHPDRTRCTWLGGNMFCIPKGSRHAREAWDLLVWMQSDEAQILFASLMNNVPNRLAALKSPVLREGEDYRRKFSVFLDVADSPNAGNFPAIPVANLYSAELLTARDLILHGEKKPEQALRDVRVRVQRELDKYR